MAKRALCVGINDYPQPGSDLKGCVNDARAWADVLHRQFDVAKDDIELLVDRGATKRRIVQGLERLLTGARRGDVLVFCISSHGTYLADATGDEPDRYDEALCPYDVADAPLADDELRARFGDLPRGVRLTVVADTCHSGSVTRARRSRVRFMDPSLIGRPVVQRAPRHRASPPVGREILVSGCRDDQYAHDARFGRRDHGAMTHAALQILRASDHHITYRDLRARLAVAVRAAGFEQDPQVQARGARLDWEVFR